LSGFRWAMTGHRAAGDAVSWRERLAGRMLMMLSQRWHLSVGI